MGFLYLPKRAGPSLHLNDNTGLPAPFKDAAICALMSNAGLHTRCRPMGEQGVQKIMGYSNHFVMTITSAKVKV
jgi:hypothetical protein